jgi:hypothetical protein
MAGNSANPAQLTLVDPEGRKVGRRKTGRHERALDRACRELKLTDDHVLDAAVSLARALACGLDTAELKGDAYGTAQLANQYAAQLARLGLVPSSRSGGDGDDDPLGFGGPE